MFVVTTQKERDWDFYLFLIILMMLMFQCEVQSKTKLQMIDNHLITKLGLILWLKYKAQC